MIQHWSHNPEATVFLRPWTKGLILLSKTGNSCPQPKPPTQKTVSNHRPRLRFLLQASPAEWYKSRRGGPHLCVIYVPFYLEAEYLSPKRLTFSIMVG